jgi:hypothetical protein
MLEQISAKMLYKLVDHGDVFTFLLERVDWSSILLLRQTSSAICESCSKVVKCVVGPNMTLWNRKAYLITEQEVNPDVLHPDTQKAILGNMDKMMWSESQFNCDIVAGNRPTLLWADRVRTTNHVLSNEPSRMGSAYSGQFVSPDDACTYCLDKLGVWRVHHETGVVEKVCEILHGDTHYAQRSLIALNGRVYCQRTRVAKQLDGFYELGCNKGGSSEQLVFPSSSTGPMTFVWKNFVVFVSHAAESCPCKGCKNNVPGAVTVVDTLNNKKLVENVWHNAHDIGPKLASMYGWIKRQNEDTFVLIPLQVFRHPFILIRVRLGLDERILMHFAEIRNPFPTAIAHPINGDRLFCVGDTVFCVRHNNTCSSWRVVDNAVVVEDGPVS